MLEVGRVGRPHGVRGEVTVTLITDRVERVAPAAILDVDGQERVVAASRPHRQGWLVRFEGIYDRAAAETLRGAVLRAAPLADDDDRWWAEEVVGAEVRHPDGRVIGRVVAIEANPAHDILVLGGGGLIPSTFVLERREGVLVVELPDGLLDVNRPERR